MQTFAAIPSRIRDHIPRAALWRIGLIAVGTVACVLAAGFDMAQANVSLPRQKILLIAAQYGVLLPAIALALWGATGRPETHSLAALRFRWLAVAYLGTIIPTTMLLSPGVFSADESTYLFEARCIASGSLYMPAPPLSSTELHFTHHLLMGGKWFGKYPFAWPTILAPAMMLHIGWLINPLLGFLILVLTYRVAEHLFSREVAWCSSLLLACSPFFYINVIGYMSHVASGAATAAAILCCVFGAQSRKVRWMVLAVTFVSLAVLFRPFSGGCIAVVLACAVAFMLRRDLWLLGRIALFTSPIVVGSICVLAMTNHAVTGSFTRSAYAFYHRAASPIEVSLSPRIIGGVLVHQTPVRLADTVIGAFPFVFLLAPLGLWRQRHHWHAWLLAAVFAGLVLGYAVQREDSDSPVGERYYWEGFPAVCILAGAGWQDLRHRVSWARGTHAAVVAATMTAAAAGLVLYMGQQFRWRWPYREIARAADAVPIRSGVVFLTAADGYTPALYNPNRPGASVLFVPDPAKRTRAEIAAKLGRTSWAVLTYDPRTHQAWWRAEGVPPSFNGAREQ